MAVVTKHMNTSPERVWAELSDGWMYTGWVVGATHIRDVDEGWPAVGTKLHHQIGAWPATISDSTQVIESEPTRRLVLQARAWPVGEARVVLEIEPDAGGTVVRMGEAPTDGVPKWLHNPLQDALLKKRNAESLERLADIAEKRPMPGFSSAGRPTGAGG
ncbi:MAG: hypothetical protein QOE97_2578 [Pseudonocardiales bacterium]|nr:hypothetical protein [Pseudonocardiales bacterium]